MKPQQVIERIFWTAVSAGGGALLAGPILGVSAWQAAGVAALSAAVNGVTIYARHRLSVLPDPGDGLPGFEVSPRVSP